jgi:hypothetical protein
MYFTCYSIFVRNDRNVTLLYQTIIYWRQLTVIIVHLTNHNCCRSRFSQRWFRSGVDFWYASFPHFVLEFIRETIPSFRNIACVRMFFIFRFVLYIRFCMHHLPSYFTDIFVLLFYIVPYRGFWYSSFFWYSYVDACACASVKYYVMVFGTNLHVAFDFYVRRLYFPLCIWKFSKPHSLSHNRLIFHICHLPDIFFVFSSS